MQVYPLDVQNTGWVNIKPSGYSTLWTRWWISLQRFHTGFDSYRTVALSAGRQTEQARGDCGLYPNLSPRSPFPDCQCLTARHLSINKNKIGKIYYNRLKK